MGKDNPDVLARALAALRALRDNVAQLSVVDEVYVTEYHDTLDMLEGIGIDTAQFRVPASQVQFDLLGMAKFVPKYLLLTKLDTVLNYFQIITPEKPKKIGFSPPSKQ